MPYLQIEILLGEIESHRGLTLAIEKQLRGKGEFMRDIRFRAWQDDKEVRRMIYPKDLIEYAELEFSGQGDNSMRPSFFCAYRSYVPPGNFVLMQYTGLKDKNGKEGYHKDIVRRMDKLYVIEWHNNLASWYLEPIYGGWHGITGSDMSLMCEIIGNIYENPELLRVVK